jgi:4'-phosphopantetheinyl transferase
MDRFLAPDAARRFLLARAGLRGILGWYLGVDPQTLRLVYGPQGKPGLEASRYELQFNLSHSGDLAVLGVAVDQPLGVDLERVEHRENLLRIARRMFPAKDSRRLGELQGESRLHVFLQLWTAMEARAKARGQGLFAPPPGEHPGDPEVRHLIPSPGYLAAVAAPRLPRDPRRWLYLEPSWENTA